MVILVRFLTTEGIESQIMVKLLQQLSFSNFELRKHIGKDLYSIETCTDNRCGDGSREVCSVSVQVVYFTCLRPF